MKIKNGRCEIPGGGSINPKIIPICVMREIQLLVDQVNNSDVSLKEASERYLVFSKLLKGYSEFILESTGKDEFSND